MLIFESKCTVFSSIAFARSYLCSLASFHLMFCSLQDFITKLMFTENTFSFVVVVTNADAAAAVFAVTVESVVSAEHLLNL